MSVSKIDIENKSFSKSFRGYHPAAVDHFLNEVADAMGALADEKRELARRVEHLEQKLDEHKEREETLRDTLMTTQKMIDELKANAQKESQLILDDAHSRAESILNQAHQRLAQIHEDITELKRQRTQFEVKLRGTLEAHLKILDMDASEEEQYDNLENKLKFFKKAT